MLLKVDIKHRQGNFRMECNFECDTSSLGIFGCSGSGKSTLFRALSGLTKPDSGNIFFNGRTLFNSDSKIFIPPERRRVGLVFQDARLFPHWSVNENLTAGEINRENIKQRPFSFDDIVDLLRIRPLIERSINDLSGGEMRRIAIGRTLLSNPELLLLDEPLTGLDAQIKSQILPFFSRIHNELKIPTILISHDLSEIMSLTENIALMKNGRITAHDSLGTLIEDPHSLNAFQGAELINFFNCTVAKHIPENGITELSLDKCNSLKTQINEEYPPGSQIKAGIHANQIAIARSRHTGLSMRNQIPARVEKVIHSSSRSLCILICCSQRVFVEITPETEKEMGLKRGTDLWILFKSASITNIIS